jgi:hypothetical protein
MIVLILYKWSLKLVFGIALTTTVYLMSCESSQCMKDYYITNKNSLVTIRTLSKTLADNYAFEQVTVKKKDVGVEIMFEGGDGNNATIYLKPSDLSLRSESVVDGCSSEALTRFRAMYNSNTIRDILNLFEDINITGAQIKFKKK